MLNNFKLSKKIWVMVFSFLLSACSSSTTSNGANTIQITDAQKKLGIENVPTSLGSQYTNNFNRYTYVTAPNGGKIHIVAQNLLTDEQIVRSRSVLQHFLANYPGSIYGNDKSAVANQMAKNGAILLLRNGADGDTHLDVPGQPLYQKEIQVEGGDWYTRQNYEYRDATFEEILHLVHDYGIGVDGRGGLPGALLYTYQVEIRNAQDYALKNKLWGIGSENARWINELTGDNSLSQEYLAAVIDAYYGLWGAWSDPNQAKSRTHSMWGIYIAKDRSEISKEDLKGQELLNNKFFHPYLTYNARIDAGFTGTFSLAFDDKIPYTHASRYLKDITLLGSNNTNVKVNELDNNITGNSGENTVIFSGAYSQYKISTVQGITTIADSVSNRNGTNVLKNIEKAQFSDRSINL